MRTTYTAHTLALCMAALSTLALAQDRAPAGSPSGADGRQPPPQAFADCVGKQAGATVQHTTPDGKVPAVCTESSTGLVARPSRPREPAGAEPTSKATKDSSSPRSDAGRDGSRQYSLEQATPDRA